MTKVTGYDPRGGDRFTLEWSSYGGDVTFTSDLSPNGREVSARKALDMLAAAIDMSYTLTSEEE